MSKPNSENLFGRPLSAGTKSPAGPRELSCNSDSHHRLLLRVLEPQSAKLRTLLISVIDMRG